MTMQPVFDGEPLLTGLTPGLKYTVHPPTAGPEPILAGGQNPVDSLGVSYGCAIEDGGRYRMWYQAWPDDWDGQDTLQVALAESDDGLSWRRCDCGLVERNGSKHNPLTDLPMHSHNVVLQPDAPPEQRYRVFGFYHPRAVKGREADFAHLGTYRGYATATSADGIHWPAASVQRLWPSEDVITAAPQEDGSVLLVMKRGRLMRGLLRRTFYTARWKDGQLSEPIEALWPDEMDDVLTATRGQMNTGDYYGLGLSPGPAGSVTGFLWNFRHNHPLGHDAKHHLRTWGGESGKVDISLVRRFREGGGWHHLPGRPVWLGPEHLPDWAAGCIYTSPRTLDVGSQTRLYFSGTVEDHGWSGVGDHLQHMRSNAGHGGFVRLGLLEWPTDRLVSLDAFHRERVALDGRDSAGRTLRLNVRTAPQGVVRAAVVDGLTVEPIDGFRFEDCQVITGDHLGVEVRWGEKTTIPPSPQKDIPLAILIEMKQASLFAFELA